MREQILFVLLSLVALSIRAGEGMRMLTNLKTQNAVAMRELGLEIPIEEVYNANGLPLKDAIVHFGGGCVGGVISSEGLVLTNHHCGYGAIQQHSNVGHDYPTDGFWAINRDAELPTPGLAVTFIDRILDVADYISEQLKKDPDPNGANYLSPSYLGNVAGRFAKAEDIEITSATKLELKAFYEGSKYYLFIKAVYSDIHMMGVPPSSVGKFGANTDNWMWSRHTGDFSLLHIYAGKNGEPAEYSKDNVSLQVKKHLKISLAGVQGGDFTLVVGFPGRNWRYMIAGKVEERMQTTNLMRRHVRGTRQKVLMEQMLKDPAVHIHHANKYAPSANYWENAIGMNKGLTRLNILDTEHAQQEELLAHGREKGDDSCQKAFDEVRSIVSHRHDALYRQQAINETLVTTLDFMRIPSTTGLVTALKPKDKERVKEAELKLKKEDDRYFAPVPFPDMERMVAKEMLKTHANYIPAERRVSIFEIINSRFKGDIDAFVDARFEHSIFGNPENFEKFIKKPSLCKIGYDWMVLFRYSVTNRILKTTAAIEEANQNYDAAHRVWVKGMIDMRQEKETSIYPDASSTLRLACGQVLSYEPTDGAVYDAHTTLRGVMERGDQGNQGFVVPQKLKGLYNSQDYGRYGKNGEMPVCFIVNTDSTGGNSDSPVFNSKGQLVGTAFDHNFEDLTGDIAFRPSSQRAACVDIRCTLFIIDKYAGAPHIIDELSIE